MMEVALVRTNATCSETLIAHLSFSLVVRDRLVVAQLSAFTSTIATTRATVTGKRDNRYAI